MIIQFLAKVFIPLDLFHMLSNYNKKLHVILLEFYGIDQYKIVYNGEVKAKC